MRSLRSHVRLQSAFTAAVYGPTASPKNLKVSRLIIKLLPHVGLNLKLWYLHTFIIEQAINYGNVVFRREIAFLLKAHFMTDKSSFNKERTWQEHVQKNRLSSNKLNIISLIWQLMTLLSLQIWIFLPNDINVLYPLWGCLVRRMNLKIKNRIIMKKKKKKKSASQKSVCFCRFSSNP